MATGGGIVLKQENRALLQSHPFVVYLCATLEQLVQRTAKDKRRPLLQVENPREKLRLLLEERDALYRQVSNFVVETDQSSPKNVVQKIVDLFQPA